MRLSRDLPGLAGGWLALVLAGLYGRPLLPVDETRYAGVAWEMWSRGDFLVPYLNGAPYSHKPPLLFWVLQGGWGLFGVNEWWPRLAPALFALGALLLTRALARRLWPERPEAARLAPVMVLGSLLWALFTGALMFDLLLSCWVLLALLGLLEAAGGARRGWLLAATGLGLGILTKGPVVLLHVLPVAFLAPWWLPPERDRRAWYGGLALALALAAVIGLAWAVPAALSGGPEYARAIFWGQTAERMVESFAHRHPWWWYLPLLPLLLFPWLLWPPLWRSLGQALHDRRPDRGLRFCLAWLLPVFLVFCLISGKQAHYLLPLFPTFALLAARGLTARARPVGGAAQGPVAVVPVLAGLALLALPHLPPAQSRPGWVGELPAAAGVGMILLGVALLLPWRPRPVAQRAVGLAAATLALVVLVNLAVLPRLVPHYDLHAISRLVALRMAEGRPVAFVGAYHQQFHFFGRLRQPLETVAEEEVSEWAVAHPRGWLVSYDRRGIPANLETGPAYEQPYRSKDLSLWPAAALAPSGAPVAQRP